MTIYSSDYNARTRQMEQDTAQRVRETALMAAVQVVGDSGSTYTLVTARKFEEYIRTGRTV